jgi:hydroxypyruvate reductase
LSARRTLLESFDAALRAVDGRACVRAALQPCDAPRARVFAIGKAASRMALGARDALGRRVEQMLVITKSGHRETALDAPDVLQLEGPHPVPDARSLEHGDALLQALGRMPPDVLPVFLVSGGSSSLVEALREGVSLDELVALNAHGLAAGWDIARLNAERVRLSRIKGGGISRMLGARHALALFISDVPRDDVEVIGSGLLGRGGHADRIERRVVANIEAAVQASVLAAGARGLRLEAAASRFDGDAVQVAGDFIEALRATTADGLVWGGESTVELPERTGRGGRNTHLALAVARMLAPGEPLAVLAAGTDGTDGPTDDAGALVDAGSVQRAELAGCDVERAFREFDSGTALEAAGDLVHTGPTGTNVGDLLIGIRRSANSLRGRGGPRVL